MLSAKGKVWLQTAKTLLQIELERAIGKRPQLELDSEELTKFAFESHANVYWAAGLDKIEILDLIRIGFTPDFSEWLDERSRVQAYDISGKLVQAWTKDVIEAVQQRSESAAEYFKEILK
jgi:hypothetical protein